MRRLILAAMLAAAAFGAVSCVGRGSEGMDGKDPGQETEFASAEISLSYKASEDVLEIVDIGVEYTDAQGTVHSESDISGTWSLKTVADEFPAMVCFKPVFTLREESVCTDETYRLDAGSFSVNITMIDAEGNKKVYANSSIGESIAVRGDKVAAWVGRQNAREAHCYTLEASGNVNISTSSSEGGE